MSKFNEAIEVVTKRIENNSSAEKEAKMLVKEHS
jgi:hypothetical protein